MVRNERSNYDFKTVNNAERGVADVRCDATKWRAYGLDLFARYNCKKKGLLSLSLSWQTVKKWLLDKGDGWWLCNAALFDNFVWPSGDFE